MPGITPVYAAGIVSGSLTRFHPGSQTRRSKPGTHRYRYGRDIPPVPVLYCRIHFLLPIHLSNVPVLRWLGSLYAVCLRSRSNCPAMPAASSADAAVYAVMCYTGSADRIISIWHRYTHTADSMESRNVRFPYLTHPGCGITAESGLPAEYNNGG